MKIVAINSLGYGSPAKIMNNILKEAYIEMEAEIFSFYGAWGKKSTEKFSYQFGFKGECLAAKYLSRITGYQHIWCYFSTKNLIKRLESIKPDIIHLHNLHLWNINVPMLFRYIKHNSINTIWTLHDCWSFTGQCPYFSEINCDKWKCGCHHCAQLERYPKTYMDKTDKMYKMKKEWFTGVDSLTIVTPSIWLKKLVKQSYLSEYPCVCINNGIDMSIFKYTEGDFRRKNRLEEKKIILGVALEWGHRKGLDIFEALAYKLPNNYQIILVGISKQEKKTLPNNIITLSRTHNQQELVELYSTADVFLNPTREDNFPTVNLEALACGTPVITSVNGGSPETVTSENGIVCDIEDIDNVIDAIYRIVERKSIDRKKCIRSAQNFNAEIKFKEYIELYKTY